MTTTSSLARVRARLRETPPGRAIRAARRRWRATPHRQERERLALRRRWEAEGRSLPAPAELKIDEVVRYVRDFGPRAFVETGTYLGETLTVVKDEVAKAWSIELSPRLAALARVTFARDPHVEILEGDSATLLPRVLDQLHEPALFWLDGHWSEGETAKGSLDTPIRAELDAVLAHHVDQHVVLIDDARLFGTGDYPTIAELESLVRERRPHWVFEVRDDIIRTHPPRPR